MNKIFSLTALSMAVALTACGGGGDDATESGETPPAVQNTAPVARVDASQSVALGATVLLDGSTSSDADKDELTYRWTWAHKPSGSQASLSSETAVRPSFVADVAGLYVVELTVNDGKADSEVVKVSVTVAQGNAAPVANAGPALAVATGASVNLDGRASTDADGDVLQYTWSMLSVPTGSRAVLSDPTAATPSFVADVAGNYHVQLLVSDGKVASAPVEVVVTASTKNVAPVAKAGATQSVATNTAVTLDGSTSADPDGDPLTYLWSFTSKPEGSAAKLSSETAVRPNFVADKAGDYVLSLVVNDGHQDSQPASVVVSAAAVETGISLYEISDGFFGAGEETLRSWPYASTGSAVYNCMGSCGTTYKLKSFKLTAQGQNYTITGLSAVNSTPGSEVKVSIKGLRNGQVIGAGKTVPFELHSDFTRGAAVSVKFAFTIKETGERFSYNASLQTN